MTETPSAPAGLAAGTGSQTITKRGSVFAIGMRVTQLDASGAPIVGASSAFVTDNLTKIDFQINYRAGITAERLNGTGRACLYYQAPSSVKELTVNSVEVCYPDPDMEYMLAGGVILSDTNTPTPNNVGYAAPAQGAVGNPNGVAIEAWSNAVGNAGIDPVAPYIRWLFPRVWLEQEAMALETAPMAMAFKGFGFGNAGYGNGPFNDWPYESDRIFQHYRTSYIPDFSVNNYVPVLVDGPTVGG